MSKDSCERGVQSQAPEHARSLRDRGLPHADLDGVLEAMEDRARDAIFANTTWSTPESIAREHQRDGSLTANEVRSWETAGRIFSVERDGRSFYPHYVFDDFGAPISEVAEILQIFKGYKALRIAAWFESTNSGLRGLRPRELLRTNPAAVVAMARDHVVGAAHG
jgi:hypothetical protein